MKIIIFGLGNFGSTLAINLTQMGHEVIGVDKDMSKVQLLKDDITYSICMDSTDAHAVSALPLKEADIIIVAVGEDVGASIMTTALMKQMKVKYLISRAISSLHETVLEAMEIDEIMRPEQETAIRLAKKINLKGFVDSYEVSSDHNVVELLAPEAFVGKTLSELNLTQKYNVLVLTTIKIKTQMNLIGLKTQKRVVQDVATKDTVIEKGDILLVYGAVKDLKRLISEEE